MISERDYVCKIALLGRSSKETKVKEINTKSRNLITVTTKDTVDACMHKMLSKGIRHLPLLDDDGKVCVYTLDDVSQFPWDSHGAHEIKSYVSSKGDWYA